MDTETQPSACIACLNHCPDPCKQILDRKMIQTRNCQLAAHLTIWSFPMPYITAAVFCAHQVNYDQNAMCPAFVDKCSPTWTKSAHGVQQGNSTTTVKRTPAETGINILEESVLDKPQEKSRGPSAPLQDKVTLLAR